MGNSMLLTDVLMLTYSYALQGYYRWWVGQSGNNFNNAFDFSSYNKALHPFGFFEGGDRFACAAPTAEAAVAG
jgi:hypothetical protein